MKFGLDEWAAAVRSSASKLHLKSPNEALWDEAARSFVIQGPPKGKAIESIGNIRGGKLHLHPVEALFLLETRNLRIIWNNGETPEPSPEEPSSKRQKVDPSSWESFEAYQTGFAHCCSKLRMCNYYAYSDLRRRGYTVRIKQAPTHIQSSVGIEIIFEVFIPKGKHGDKPSALKRTNPGKPDFVVMPWRYAKYRFFISLLLVSSLLGFSAPMMLLLYLKMSPLYMAWTLAIRAKQR